MSLACMSSGQTSSSMSTVFVPVADLTVVEHTHQVHFYGGQNGLCLQHMVQGMSTMYAGAASAAAAGECPGHGLPGLLHPLTAHSAAMHFHRSGTKQLLTICKLGSAVGDKLPYRELFHFRMLLSSEETPVSRCIFELRSPVGLASSVPTLEGTFQDCCPWSHILLHCANCRLQHLKAIPLSC